LIFITVGIIEFYKSKNKAKFLIFALILFSLFVFGFSYLGTLRIGDALTNTIQNYYGMDGYPLSFTWFYIYLTSPLENFSYTIMNQEVEYYTYGLRLFYVFFQVPFRLAGENLSHVVDAKTLYPYLSDVAGLTVSTFMKSAFQDFGVIGPFIYVLVLCLFIYASLYMATYSPFAILFLALNFNMVIWMVFVNPFEIGAFLIGWLTLIFLTVLKSHIVVRPHRISSRYN
jgi:oligosaccharide repeat unit polymerase